MLRALMDDTPVRREIDGLIEELLAPLIAARPGPRGYRLVSWDAEQGVCLTLQRGSVVILVELERRDDARDCLARTERFNVCARRPFDARALDAQDRRAVDQLVAMIRAREGALPRVERSPSSRRSMVRLVEVERALIPEGSGHYYLNPYVGCTLGCEFCYVAERADFSRALEALPAVPWGRWVDAKINAPEVLRREVASLPPGVVRLSPLVTDPYQPLERRLRITRACLEVLQERDFTPVVLTRAALVLEDLPLLASFRSAGVGFSIPTDDDGVRRQFEPGGDPIAERLAALRACHAAGLRTFAVIQPLLPMDPNRLVEAVAPYVHAVRVDRMHQVERLAPLYERCGRTEASRESFFEEVGRKVRQGFAGRGVPCDEFDDLSILLRRS
jgi:DNA repair photolyase